MKLDVKYPENVIRIARILGNNGFKAYAVGGCMRDSVMGRSPADWDMTTDASPEEMLSIFASQGIRTIPTGLQHGTVSILLDDEIYECTTFRIDGEYSDSRHPNSVEFTKDVKDDLCRRDFTINALAGSPDSDDIIDLFDGIDDIKKKTVRCVGDPETRFTEDALRILRAVRFATVLDFEIEKDTKAAAQKLGSRLLSISAERKCVELEKILLSDHADHGITRLLEMGLSQYIHPDLKAPVVPLISLPKDFAIRLSALFDGNTPPNLSQMKLSGAVTKQVKLLCDKPFYESVLSVFPDDLSASARLMISKFGAIAKSAAILRNNVTLYNAIQTESQKNPCIKLSDLAIGGADLLKFGIEDKKIGKIMQDLLLLVIETPEINEKSALLERAAAYKES